MNDELLEKIKRYFAEPVYFRYFEANANGPDGFRCTSCADYFDGLHHSRNDQPHAPNCKLQEILKLIEESEKE
jgi:hypothetical protein